MPTIVKDVVIEWRGTQRDHDLHSTAVAWLAMAMGATRKEQTGIC
jgi:hypothetical protein